MNVENIKRVRDHIEKLPPSKFDMQWLGDEPSRGCGSACCIAGWAHRVLGLDGFTDAATRAFGLTERQGFDLMWPPVDPERSPAWEATSAQAVRVLDILIETGRVDWDRALAEVPA